MGNGTRGSTGSNHVKRKDRNKRDGVLRLGEQKRLGPRPALGPLLARGNVHFSEDKAGPT